MSVSQSSLGGTVVLPNGAPISRPLLRTGRISAPVSPASDPLEFDKYVARCLRTWSVDVRLDSGEYLMNCRVVSPQGNGREGLRRMFRFPVAAGDGAVMFGDIVVVGFLNGLAAAPVVLGALSPMWDLATPDATLEDNGITTRDAAEWQDRHDHLNLDDPNQPLASSTMTRDSGLTREHEHQSQTVVDGVVRNAHLLDRTLAARSTQREHVVEGSDGVSIVRAGNTEAQDLTHAHIVQASDTTSSVVVEDLKAQVLQLTQQVGELQKFVLRSDNAKTLSAQQDTSAYRLTVVSDADSKTMSVVHQDLDTGSQGGLTLSPDSRVVLRRATPGQPESFVLLDSDGSVTLRSANGASVRLDTDELLLTSKNATIHVSESHGVSVTTAGGTMLSAQDDAVVVSAPACTVRGGEIHLNSGVVRTGQGEGVASGVPSIETLYQKLLKLELWSIAMDTFARLHIHTATGPSAPTTPPTTPPAASVPSGQFNPGTAASDALQTFRGE